MYWHAYAIACVLVPVAALQCKDVKDFYKQQSCCGNAQQSITLDSCIDLKGDVGSPGPPGPPGPPTTSPIPHNVQEAIRYVDNLKNPYDVSMATA
jgi:hypothetical protein